METAVSGDKSGKGESGHSLEEKTDNPVLNSTKSAGLILIMSRKKSTDGLDMTIVVARTIDLTIYLFS